MTIRLLFFSIFRDLTGCAETTVKVASNTSVDSLCEQLFRLYPKLAAWKGTLLVAVNETYAKSSEILHHGDEVALMPPVQGG